MKRIRPFICIILTAAMLFMMAGCGSSSENAGTGSSGTEEVQGKLDVSAVTEYRYDLYIADDGTFEGVKALDYVTLPEDIDSISFKDAAVDIDQDRKSHV